MVNALTFTAWAQKVNSLAKIFPAKIKSTNIDYVDYDHIHDVFAAIKKKDLNPEIVAGWGLGGQVAVRGVAEKIFKPRLLVLIAPPYNYIQQNMDSTKLKFKAFMTSFSLSPEKTIKYFYELVGEGDKEFKQAAREIEINPKNMAHWQYWLTEMGYFSADSIKLDNFPRTLIIQSKRDMITDANQAVLYKDRLPDCKLLMLDGNSHAPHIRCGEEVKKAVDAEIVKLGIK